MRDVSEKLAELWDTALLEKLNSDAETQQNAQYSLRKYTQHEIDNWSNSPNITVYQGEHQFEEFVQEAVDRKDFGKKIYFGAISDELAERIEKATGVSVAGYNCTLRAHEVRKILKDHGVEKTENMRGQRAISISDFASIPEIVQNADDIRLSPNKFEGKPVVEFVKTIDGKTTVVSYVSKKHHDLTVQTMYAGKNKGNLATAADEQASANTPKAHAGTVSDSSITQGNGNSKGDAEKYVPQSVGLQYILDRRLKSIEG